MFKELTSLQLLQKISAAYLTVFGQRFHVGIFFAIFQLLALAFMYLFCS